MKDVNRYLFTVDGIDYSHPEHGSVYSSQYVRPMFELLFDNPVEKWEELGYETDLWSQLSAAACWYA